MLTDVLRALAPALAQSGVVLGIVSALVAWATWSGFWLYTASATLSRTFRAAARAASASADELSFVSGYELFSAEISRLPLIGFSWAAFRQTLILPASISRPITATSDPREWFDLAGLFRAAGADLRYQAALPGLLVGAGLMVTFLGLAAALTAASDVVAEGVSQVERNTALRTLLGAASVKFITSLVGLALSIVYALFRKWRVKSVEQAYSAFAVALHARIPFRTAAYLQAEANILLGKQHADIQRIGTDFFVNLGSTLERTFDTGLDQHIGPLRHAIETLSNGLATQNRDAMETMMRAFLDRLEGTIGGALTEGAEAGGKRLSDAAASFGTDVKALSARLTQAGEAIGAGLRDGASSFDSSIEAASARLMQAGDAIGTGLRDGTADLQVGLAELNRALATSSSSLAEQLSELGKASASLVERTEALDRATRSVESPLVVAAADLRAAAEAAQSATVPLRGSADGLASAAAALGASQRDADQLANRLTEAAARFAGLDDSLARTLRALSEGLSGYHDKIREFVLDIDGGLSRNVAGLTAIAKGLEDAVEDFHVRTPSGRA